MSRGWFLAMFLKRLIVWRSVLMLLASGLAWGVRGSGATSPEPHNKSSMYFLVRHCPQSSLHTRVGPATVVHIACTAGCTRSRGICILAAHRYEHGLWDRARAGTSSRLRNIEARARPSTGFALHFSATNSMSASVASVKPHRKPASICLACSSVSFSARLDIMSASKAEFCREWLEQQETSLSQHGYGVCCEYDHFRTVWCILLHGAKLR